MKASQFRTGTAALQSARLVSLAIKKGQHFFNNGLRERQYPRPAQPSLFETLSAYKRNLNLPDNYKGPILAKQTINNCGPSVSKRRVIYCPKRIHNYKKRPFIHEIVALFTLPQPKPIIR